MSPVGFQPPISAGDWQQFYAIDRTTNGNVKYWRSASTSIMTYLPHHFAFSIWINLERYEVPTPVLPEFHFRFKSSGIRRDLKLFIRTYVSGAENFPETSASHKTVTFTQELICLAIHYSSTRSLHDVCAPNLLISLLILCCRDECNPTFPWFPCHGRGKKWFFAAIKRYLVGRVAQSV
jgi:hypothetical protein